MRLFQLMQIISICIISSFSYSQKNDVKYTAPPTWVELVTFDKKIKETNNSGSYLFLLVDNQDHVSKKEFYRHRSLKVLNPQGIQEMSDIEISFDPSYQHIEIHHIEIIRNNEVLNKLNKNNIQLIQRETNLERHLYDGSLSAIINISDVRVNDIINYSYTIVGDNPIHEGKYSNSFYIDFTIPIKKIFYRVSVPKEEPLFYRVYNSDVKPSITTSGDFKNYTLERTNAEILKYEDNTPDWYDASGFIQFSQFKDWNELVTIYHPYYTISNASNNWLKEQSSTLLTPETEDSISTIINFVQDDIRYLGFEGGLNSHAPSNPKEVYMRRYGDCKDKSLLLSGLLNTIGIEAYPVLVHSYNNKSLNEKLPSPNLFDHCIVQVNLPDGVKYIDPTINSQGGKIDNRFFPDYKKGLVLKTDSKDIVDIKPSDIQALKIYESLKLDKIGGGATLNVSTAYYDIEADTRRREFSESTLEEIQELYLDFYSNLYPGIEAKDEIIFDDFRKSDNKFIVTESYSIDSIWTPQVGNEEIILAHIYPLSLDAYLYPTEDKDRKMPYHVNKNLNIEHHINVSLPEDWNIQPENLEIENNIFKYSNTVTPSNRRFEIVHKFKYKTDHVAPEDYNRYITDIKKVQENVNYYLTYNSAFMGNPEASNISWATVVIVILCLGFGCFICYKIYYTYDMPARVPESLYRDGIGGWLSLLSIGLIITPIIFFFNFFISEDFFSPTVWSLWKSGYPGMTLLILFEIIFNSFLFVTSIFILILFFKKRTIAPRVIVIFMIVNTLFILFDTVIASEFFTDLNSEVDISDSYSDLAKVIIRAVIWVPYLLLSKRVKETFVVSLHQNGDAEPSKQEAYAVIE